MAEFIIEETEETLQTKVNNNTNSIEDLEQKFTSFMDNVQKQNDKLTANINVDELNNIGDEILKAREYLMSFANGERKSIREKAYNQITNLPLLGNWAKEKINEVQQQNLKDSNAKEVLQGIYNSFEVKQKRLVELTSMLSTMREDMLLNISELSKFITILDEILQSETSSPIEKMKALEMSVTAQSQHKKINESLYNNVDIIIELMGSLHYKITKALPSIKMDLERNINIVGSMNAVKDAADMLNSIEELSNEIAKKSSESIQELILSTTKAMGEGTNIDFYEDSAKRNIEYNKKLTEAKKQYISKMASDYKKLSDINSNLSNQLEHRAKEEQVLLENYLKA